MGGLNREAARLAKIARDDAFGTNEKGQRAAAAAGAADGGCSLLRPGHLHG